MPIDHRMLLQQPPAMDLATPLNMYMNMKAERRAQNQQKYLERQQRRQMEVEDLASLTLNPQTGMPDPIAYPKALAERGYIPELQAFNTQQRALKKEGLQVRALEREEGQEIDTMLGTGARALLTLPKEQFAFGWEQFLDRAKDLGEDIPDNWYQPLTPENEQQIKSQLGYLAQTAGKVGTAKGGTYQKFPGKDGFMRNYDTSTGQVSFALDEASGKKVPVQETYIYKETPTGYIPLNTKRPPTQIPQEVPGVTPAAQETRNLRARAIELQIKQADLNIAKAARDTAMGGQFKGTQYQASVYGQRMSQANEIFDDLVADGFDRTKWGAGMLDKLPNVAKTANVQAQAQAERNFVNAVLRRESGAAIADHEFTSAEKQYFPRSGDSKRVLEQKRQNRMTAVAGMKAEAGGAWDEVQDAYNSLTEDSEENEYNNALESIFK